MYLVHLAYDRTELRPQPRLWPTISSSVGGIWIIQRSLWASKMKLGKWSEFETVSTDGSTTRSYSSPTLCNSRTGLKVRAKKYVRSVLLNRHCSLVGARLKSFSVPYPRTEYRLNTKIS